MDTTIYQNRISNAYNKEVHSGPDKNVIDDSISDEYRVNSVRYGGYGGCGYGGYSSLMSMQGMQGMQMRTNPSINNDTESLYNKKDSTEKLEKTQVALDIATTIASLFMK